MYADSSPVSAENSKEQSPLIQISDQDSGRSASSLDSITAIHNFLLPCLRSIIRLLRWLLSVQSFPCFITDWGISRLISSSQFLLFNLMLISPTSHLLLFFHQLLEYISYFILSTNARVIVSIAKSTCLFSVLIPSLIPIDPLSLQPYQLTQL